MLTELSRIGAVAGIRRFLLTHRMLSPATPPASGSVAREALARGNAAYNVGDQYGTALAEYEIALEAWGQCVDTAALSRVTPLRGVANCRLQMGQPDQAAAVYQLALAVLDPGDDSNRGHVLYGLAEARRQLGDPAGALAALRDAQPLLERTAGSDSQHLIAYIAHAINDLTSCGSSEPAKFSAQFRHHYQQQHSNHKAQQRSNVGSSSSSSVSSNRSGMFEMLYALAFAAAFVWALGIQQAERERERERAMHADFEQAKQQVVEEKLDTCSSCGGRGRGLLGSEAARRAGMCDHCLRLRAAPDPRRSALWRVLIKA